MLLLWIVHLTVMGAVRVGQAERLLHSTVKLQGIMEINWERIFLVYTRMIWILDRHADETSSPYISVVLNSRMNQFFDPNDDPIYKQGILLQFISGHIGSTKT
jgi:hypothetical protein